LQKDSQKFLFAGRPQALPSARECRSQHEAILSLGNEGNEVDRHCIDGTEIDESHVGDAWVFGLMEGEYADLSVEEKLNALVALFNLVNSGNSVQRTIKVCQIFVYDKCWNIILEKKQFFIYFRIDQKLLICTLLALWCCFLSFLQIIFLAMEVFVSIVSEFQNIWLFKSLETTNFRSRPYNMFLLSGDV
jgi:hypothetical protein